MLIKSLSFRLFFLINILFVSSIKLSFGQDNSRSSIQFKGGVFTPTPIEDWNTFSLSRFNSELINNDYYLLIQFYSVPSEEQKNLLKQGGVTLIDYLPYNSWTALIKKNTNTQSLKSANIRSIAVLESRFKQDLNLISGDFPERALTNGGNKLNLQIIPFSEELISSNQLNSDIENLGGVIKNQDRTFRRIEVTIPKIALGALAKLPWVLWIEAPDAKPVTENLPGKTLHRSNVLNDGPRNLTGDGVRIGQWDGGKAGPHLDFLNRLIIRDNVASDDHHTHVAGTMLGAGIIDPFARGMAPKATLYSYDYNGSVSTEVASSLANDQIVISQNSWGYGNGFVNCTNRDPYNSESRAQDLNITSYPYFLHVHSAGNSQSVCTGGWGTTTGKAAKNTLVVANVSSADAINSSSSFGPTQDGRLKPEISGLGVNVYSTTPNNTYTGGYTGTSMATPGVSGTMAQIYERFRQLNANANPIASLLKAVACNTAKDLGNAGPDYKFGFGRINGLQAVRAIETNRYEVNTISNAQTKTTTITIPAGVTRVRVMLAWTDPAATANANPALVNDLDLVLKDPSNVSTLPWTLDPANPGNVAVRAVNRRDVMEQITLDNPAAGNYTIEVNGFSVPTGPTQQYAITWEIETPFIEVNYPNGTEVLVPGVVETVQWSNVGITGNQTIQYSLNNGSTWTTLSSTLAATVNQYAWTIPNNVTAQALVRVFSGAITDQSDANFSILGTPTLSFSNGCTIGQVTLNWTSVTNATSYDVLKLDETTATWNVLFSNVVGTSQLVSGLSPATSSWFSVQSRNNAGSVIGQRSIAKEVTGSSLSGSSIVATADSISGCAPFNTTLRTVLNATSYTVSAVSLPSYSGTPTNITTWSGNADDGFAEVTLPFSFKFYGQDYSSVFISTNAHISFGAGSTAYQQQTIPSATSPNNLVALAWADYNLTSGSIGYFVSGTAPNRKFVIVYNAVPPYSGTGSLSGQIVLNETNNIIDLLLSNQNIGGSKTQGVENSTGTSANATSGRNNAAWTVSTAEAYRYIPTTSGTYLWSPSTGLNSTTVQYPTVTGLNATTTYTVTATIGTCVLTDTVLITLCPQVFLNLNCLLQGMTLSGTMPPYLYQQGLSANTNASDLITVELRNSTSPYALVSSSTSEINNVGLSLHKFNNTTTGSYYVVVKNRNSIETWSKNPVSFTVGATTNYSFKTP